MPKIEVKTPFKFAIDGIRVIEIQPGVQDVDDAIAEVALEAGWAVAAGAPEPKKIANKAHKRAPEVG